MKSGIIITLPGYDPVTTYLSAFSKEIIGQAESIGLPVTKIAGKNVDVENVSNSLSSFPYSLFVFNGHGDEKTLFGHQGCPVIEESKNDSLLYGRITYSRACDSASSLGKNTASKDPQSCFIGYDLPFWLYHDITWETNPSKDKTAEIFFNTSNLIPLSLLKGNTSREAHEKSQKAHLKAISKALRNKDKESKVIAEALWNNYFAQVLLGNENARV